MNSLLNLLPSWVVVLVLLFIGYKFLNFLYEQYLLRKLHCKKPYTMSRSFVQSINFLRKYLKMNQLERLADMKTRLDSVPGGTFEFKGFGSTTIITKNVENVKAIYATQFGDFDVHDRLEVLGPFLGRSIFTLVDEPWKECRSILRPQFSREQIAHVQALEPHVLTLAKHIRKYNGNPINIQPYFLKYTYDTATEFLFGESLYSLRDESIGYKPEVELKDTMAFGTAIGTASRYSSLRAVAKPFYQFVNPKKYRDACAFVHEFTGRHVQRALELTPEELEKKSQGGYYILYELVKATREPKVIGDQLLSMFLAGRYTTAATLGFLVLELTRNPEVLDKVKKEVYDNFGSGDDVNVEEITFESLKRCTYLKAAISETLRVWPVVPQNYRLSSRNTTLPRGGGKDGSEPIFVRNGQTVVWLTWAIHRDKDIYGKDADIFRPERWLEPEMRKIGFAYTPFGGGPRICLGQQFALTEVSYTAVRLLQLFPNLQAHNQPYPPDIEARLGLSLNSVNITV